MSLCQRVTSSAPLAAGKNTNGEFWIRRLWDAKTRGRGRTDADVEKLNMDQHDVFGSVGATPIAAVAKQPQATQPRPAPDRVEQSVPGGKVCGYLLDISKICGPVTKEMLRECKNPAPSDSNNPKPPDRSTLFASYIIRFSTACGLRPSDLVHVIIPGREDVLNCLPFADNYSWRPRTADPEMIRKAKEFLGTDEEPDCRILSLTRHPAGPIIRQGAQIAPISNSYFLILASHVNASTSWTRSILFYWQDSEAACRWHARNLVHQTVPIRHMRAESQPLFVTYVRVFTQLSLTLREHISWLAQPCRTEPRADMFLDSRLMPVGSFLTQFKKMLLLTGLTIWAVCDVKARVFTLTGKTPGKNWHWKFEKRHLSLIRAKPTGLDPKRAQNFNKSNVMDFFGKLKELSDSFDGIPPQNLWNMDEKGIQMGGGRKRKGNKFYYKVLRNANTGVFGVITSSW
ncbi:hypothetical protein B0H21DRAFT_713963 [Amylocystis lapponica]|nr:hypothetical protein B0H21DRAFT_713963 [Amylocystis lapponica]